MKQLLDSLARYVGILSESAETTNYADDRPIYTKHLAASAQFFLLIHGKQLSALAQLVHDERRSYGWGYLSGEMGARAESAFHEFATKVESLAT